MSDSPHDSSGEPSVKGGADNELPGFSFKPQDYAVESQVAQGGMGVIRRAIDRNTGRTVAMKVLRRDISLSHEDVLRFVREARINAQLEHPNIVPVHELGQDEEGKPFYTMKLVHGVTLEDILANIARGDAETLSQFSLAALLTIFEKVCDAVAFAHSRGIVHRDLKPSNVMVEKFGEVLVLDWGMAKALGRASSQEAPAQSSSPLPAANMNLRDVRLTAQCLLGTPSFMAPEQVENGPVDERTDIYALGGILYQILTLRPPHEEGEVYEMLDRIRSGQIRSPTAYNPPSSIGPLRRIVRRRSPLPSSMQLPHCPNGRVPEALSMVAMKALALRPEDRYPEVRDLQEDIEAYQGGFITSAETKGLFKSLKLLIRRHRVESALIAVSLLVILFLTVAYAMGERTKRLALQARLKAEEDRRRLEEKTEAERRRNWRLVFREDFSDADFLSRWETNGPWKVKDGELRIGGSEQCLRFKTPLTGDVRLVFDCQKGEGELSDLSCFLAAPKNPSVAGAFLGGYLFQYGGNLNRRIRLASTGVILWNRPASPLDRGWRYHVDARKVGNRLILTIDGQTIIDAHDERVPYGPDHAYIGFYNYMTETRYSNIQIYTRDPALAADLLEVAEEYFNNGKHAFARDLFQQVMNSSQDPARTRQAREGFEKASRCLQLIAEFPSIKARLLKIWPRAVVALGNSGMIINLNEMGVVDLRPLQGLMVTELACGGNQVTSLEPLRGMPLSSLYVGGNRISSLEPLKGMPLISLSCDLNPITDLEPLRGMKLKLLSCNRLPISSLEPLRGMRLDSLFAVGCQITSLEPLGGMQLNVLNVGMNRISSLEPLHGMSLDTLDIPSNQVKDLGPLQGTDVLYLNCARNQIASLEPLKKMNLERLSCNDNQITSLEPLRGMHTQVLDCRGNPLQTIQPLTEKPPQMWLFDLEQMSAEDRALFKAHASQPVYAENLRTAEIQFHVKHRNRAEALALARSFGGHRYLVVMMEANWAEARKISEELGGHLATITSQAENDFIQSQAPRYNMWILFGLMIEGKQPKWVTGEPFGFSSPERELNNDGYGIFLSNGKWTFTSLENRLGGFCVEWDK
jgi:serine/threonine protein kinase